MLHSHASRVAIRSWVRRCAGHRQVMASAADLSTALDKPAAGRRLPRSARLHLIREPDHQQAVPIAATLVGLRFEFYATEGTAATLTGSGNRGEAGAEAQRGNRRRADSHRPHPPWALRSRDQYAGGPQRALGRLRDPRGGARARCRASRRSPAQPPPCTRSRRRRASGGPSPSRSGSMQSSASPSRHSVTSSEPIGPYTLLRLERGDLRPQRCGDFVSCSRPRDGCCRGRSSSASRRPASSPSSSDRSGRGRGALPAAGRRRDSRARPLGHGYRLDVERPLLVGGGSGSRRCLS